jgi:uncharacterized protein
VTATLFDNRYPVVAMLHLPPLPGAPRFGGTMQDVVARALSDLRIYSDAGVDGVIVENFGDVPFFGDRVPEPTVEAMTTVVHAVREAFDGPVGVNVLRNDALAALGIAAAAKAQFIRVNVHMHPKVTEQGLLTGRSPETLRRRGELDAGVQIWADVAVKHARPLVEIPLADEARDLAERGLADVLIVSGARTGKPGRPADVDTVASATTLPVYVGSGVDDGNAGAFAAAAGFIVGSSLKHGGNANNPADARRVEAFMRAVNALRSAKA